jgi:serine/threonine-protein kinase
MKTRCVAEIKTTASLQHPHILPLFDSGTADGFLYYVMPYVEGETLRAKLDRETQLGVEEAVRIATEVADFGIALAVSAAAGGRMTESGLSLGTPHYMSPEQAAADKNLTARSDIYSLAAVLYEMLAGAPPHVGPTAQLVVMRIVTEEAAPLTAVRKSVPPNVSAAVAKGLEKVPADRFETARGTPWRRRDPSRRAMTERRVRQRGGERPGRTVVRSCTSRSIGSARSERGS